MAKCLRALATGWLPLWANCLMCCNSNLTLAIWYHTPGTTMSRLWAGVILHWAAYTCSIYGISKLRLICHTWKSTSHDSSRNDESYPKRFWSLTHFIQVMLDDCWWHGQDINTSDHMKNMTHSLDIFLNFFNFYMQYVYIPQGSLCGLNFDMAWNFKVCLAITLHKTNA